MSVVGFVSCDIIGHSAMDRSVQARRIAAINALVRHVIARDPEGVVWASGGDGGHVAFCRDGWAGEAARLILDLRRWSESEAVGLRIVGVVGDVDQIEGADGRIQLLGDGINLAGQLLEMAFSGGVLVTTPFKAALEQAGIPDLEVHEPRVLRPQYLPPQLTYLLSATGGFRSHWKSPSGGDRELLQEALADDRAWDALHLIKRLLQINSQDDQAEEAMDALGPHLLVYRRQVVDVDGRTRIRMVPNAFLGDLDARTRWQVIRSAQLVERPRGEILCRAGDAGDTMFIILRGSVGVFPSQAEVPESISEPRYVAGPGEIVGELAFALHRPRTADLVTMQDSSLLCVQATALNDYARDNPTLAADIGRFLTGRMLEYACHSVAYLIGRNGDGPLAEVGRKKSWDRLLPHAELIVWPIADRSPVTLEDPRLAGDAIFILVSGRLRSLAHREKILSGSEPSLAYVNLPGWLVCPDHEYRPEGSDAILLRIGKEAFLGRPPVIDAVVPLLLREIPRLYHFDAFLSYTMDDEAQARRWREALEEAGLRVHMEISARGHYFREGIEDAILDSLTLIALVSANTMARPLENNWVRLEIAFRQDAFEKSTAQIFPVRLQGGRPELLADGYTIIDAVDREARAIAEVIEAVQLARTAVKPPPYSFARKAHIHL